MTSDIKVCRCKPCLEYRHQLLNMGKRVSEVEQLSSPLCVGEHAPASKKNQRNIYVPQAEWDEVKTAAEAEGISMSAYIRAAIAHYKDRQ